MPTSACALKVANTESVVRMVEENEIDLGVVEGSVSNRLLLVETCLTDELVVIAPAGHALADRRPLQVAQLLEHPVRVPRGRLRHP